MREKTTTAICRTAEGIEWSSFRVAPDGTEPLARESIPMAFPGGMDEALPASIELPEGLAEKIEGDIIVPLRTAEQLMRVMELPTTQADEIADMAALQIDKISPFPADQLTLSHEVLQQDGNSSLVLLVAARRSCIDTIGDTFKEKGIRIHSIDSRVLGWMQLLKDEGHVSAEACEIIVIDDGIDFSLVVSNGGIPLAFRMLHAQSDATDVVDELAYEIEYTLTTLDAERDLPAPASIQHWSNDGLSAGRQTQLAERSGLPIQRHSLGELPPLSEGIVRRALADAGRIELIPREWVEHEKNKRLKEKAILAVSGVAGIWLAFLLLFSTVYKVRDMQLSAATRRAEAIAPAGRQALENRQKLKALKVYTDRSDSALECLREATRLLPPGNIEFVSYNYNKGKGVTLRGTAGNDGFADDYFVALAGSPLFKEIKNQSSSRKTTKGIHRTVFSVTLTLPSGEDAE